MSANFNIKGFTLEIPPRQAAKAIHIAAINGKPHLSIVDFETRKDLKVIPKYKEVTLDEMDTLLTSL